MSTPSRRSSWRFMPIPRCRRRSPRRHWTPWEGSFMPRVLLALGSVFAGAAAGAASTTAGVWALNWLQGDAVLMGSGMGLLLALIVSWICSAGLEETWRRAAIAVVASFGAMAAGITSYLLGTSSMASVAVP